MIKKPLNGSLPSKGVISPFPSPVLRIQLCVPPAFLVMSHVLMWLHDKASCHTSGKQKYLLLNQLNLLSNEPKPAQRNTWLGMRRSWEGCCFNRTLDGLRTFFQCDVCWAQLHYLAVQGGWVNPTPHCFPKRSHHQSLQAAVRRWGGEWDTFCG